MNRARVIHTHDFSKFWVLLKHIPGIEFDRGWVKEPKFDRNATRERRYNVLNLFGTSMHLRGECGSNISLETSLPITCSFPPPRDPYASPYRRSQCGPRTRSTCTGVTQSFAFRSSLDSFKASRQNEKGSSRELPYAILSLLQRPPTKCAIT